MLDIYPVSGPGQQEIVVGAQLFSWHYTGQIQFDFQFDVPQPLSASLEVTPPTVYLCSVVVSAIAKGEGWPGSLAVSTVCSTVPSISYTFAAGPPV